MFPLSNQLLLKFIAFISFLLSQVVYKGIKGVIPFFFFFFLIFKLCNRAIVNPFIKMNSFMYLLHYNIYIATFTFPYLDFSKL